jgi:hypothetical protein
MLPRKSTPCAQIVKISLHAIHAINSASVLLLSFDNRDRLLRHCTQPEYVSELRSTIVVKIINNS